MAQEQAHEQLRPSYGNSKPRDAAIVTRIEREGVDREGFLQLVRKAAVTKRKASDSLSGQMKQPSTKAHE